MRSSSGRAAARRRLSSARWRFSRSRPASSPRSCARELRLLETLYVVVGGGARARAVARALCAARRARPGAASDAVGRQAASALARIVGLGRASTRASPAALALAVYGVLRWLRG